MESHACKFATADSISHCTAWLLGTIFKAWNIFSCRGMFAYETQLIPWGSREDVYTKIRLTLPFPFLPWTVFSRSRLLFQALTSQGRVGIFSGIFQNGVHALLYWSGIIRFVHGAMLAQGVREQIGYYWLGKQRRRHRKNNLTPLGQLSWLDSSQF